MSDGRKILLVANPTAQSGRAKQTIEQARTALQEAGLATEFLATQPHGGTVSALAERLASDDLDIVAYLGGDGTFAEAAKGLILARERYGVDLPLAMLPMGTANDQGRSFGIMAGAESLRSNVAIIREGHESRLDVGRVEAIDSEDRVITSDLWFDSFGIGLGAQILAQRNLDRERLQQFPRLSSFYRDKLVYVGAAVKRLAGSIVSDVRFACQVEVDGRAREFVGCLDLIIKGTLLYAGDWIFHSGAKADDGLFELLAIRGHADLIGKTIRNHKHNPLNSSTPGETQPDLIQGRHFSVTVTPNSGRQASATGIRSQIDGEEFVSADRYRVENLPQHLRIIVPEHAHWV